MDSKCPVCGHVQRVPREYAGTQIKCRMCKTLFPAAPYYPPPAEPKPPRPPPTLESRLPSPRFFRRLGYVWLVLLNLFSFGSAASFANVLTAEHRAAAFVSFAVIAAAGCLLSCVLCCIPLGIAAIIDAINANTLAREKSENSKK